MKDVFPLSRQSEVIIGLGDGAEQSHYTRKPFWDIKITKKINTGNSCNGCSRTISKSQRYCDNCKKINRRNSQRKWRKSKVEW